MKIVVVGLGSGRLEAISLGAYRKIIKSKEIYCRTIEHPIVNNLLEEGITIHSFDNLYDKISRFEEVYKQIVLELIQASETERGIVYAVPGNPLVAEKTVELLIKEKENYPDLELTIIPSGSFLDDMFIFLEIDPTKNSFVLLDALEFDSEVLTINSDMVFTQVYDRFIASELKLQLLERIEPNSLVTIFQSAGIVGKEKKVQVPLYQLDNCGFEFDHLTSVFIPYNPKNQKYKKLSDLMEVIRFLRSEEGCPWVKKQNSKSIIPNIQDEVQELIIALENEDVDNIIEELGDVLMLLTMEAQLGDEAEYFNMYDIVDGITRKLIFRHPHVFGEEKVQTLEKANLLWEIRKKQEKVNKSQKIVENA